MTLFGNGLTLNNSSNVVGHRKSKNETDKIINWKNKMIITLKLKDVDGIAKFFQQRSTSWAIEGKRNKESREKKKNRYLIIFHHFFGYYYKLVVDSHNAWEYKYYVIRCNI